MLLVGNVRKSYAEIVRGNKISAEEERARLASYSSNDSGYEGLEDLEPLDLEDLKRPEQWYAVDILLVVIYIQTKLGYLPACRPHQIFTSFDYLFYIKSSN